MQIFERIDEREEKLPKIKGISPLIVRLLLRRGARDEAEMRAFLHPSLAGLHDPFEMRDMQAAAERIKSAIEKKERICIYGDYDVDGICAVSMLYSCLKTMQADLRYYIPSRQDEGYGLNPEAIRALAADGVKLVITVDNGIRALDEAELCYKLNMQLIITDHHMCGETLPRAEAVLCHTRADDDYPNPHICGAGTAYKLIEALAGREPALEYLALVGIATIADLVPLLDENRVFAALALKKLNKGECQKGVLALMKSCKQDRELDAHDIAFGIAPRLNAAGRLSDATLCVELLCSEDEERCEEITRLLEELNSKRQQEEAAICEEAYAVLDASDLTDKRAIALKGNWNSGVIGIAASRIAEKYYRPTMLFAEKDGLLTGSARSVPKVHLYAALLQCGGLFTRFGGHAAAAGATLPAERFDEFCQSFEEAVRNVAEDDSFLPRKYYELDAELSELDIGLAAQIRLLAPFGEGNPSPLFRVGAAHLKNLKQIGREGRHLNGVISSGIASQPFVFFGRGESLDDFLQMDRCDVLCEPSVNLWRGTSSLQIKLKALRPCLPPNTKAYIAAHEEKFIDAFSCNILYNDKDLADLAQNVNADEWLADKLSEDLCGTLVLCFTQEGAERLLERADLCERMDISFFHEAYAPCAYHALVMAPLLSEMRPWRYRNILIYDTPVLPGITKKLTEIAPDARLFIGGGDSTKLKDSLRFDRETLKPMYKAFREAGRRFYNKAELADYLARNSEKRRCLCALGIDIMLELGFALEENGVSFVKDPPQAPLENSKTFRLLQELWIDR